MSVSIRQLTDADDARRAELLTFAAAEPVTVADLADWRRCFPWRSTLNGGWSWIERNRWQMWLAYADTTRTF
jgi:hypothetical protein